MNIETLIPNWPAPSNVRAITTTRVGGVSQGAYESLNLGDHVGDMPQSVQENRARLRDTLKLPAEPIWMKQVHGIQVVDVASATTGVAADGAYAKEPNLVCVVLTADCLPIFLCDRTGTEVGIVHAGWRGLASGVVEAGVRAMSAPRNHLLAHLGPGIGRDSYEVGDDVRQAFLRHDTEAARAFRSGEGGRWWVDMNELARMRLHALGVTNITGGKHCTLRECDKFFSYRRDGVCGRMASLIWLE